MAVDQRNFGNVLDINGTEVNVEDKRLAELAGQTPKSSSQISTSSQYVPLQDTDGNIVKISPASFQEAVRNTLASLLVNNDKGTSFSQVPVIGSGDFGSASLANLASVLGDAWTETSIPLANGADRLIKTQITASYQQVYMISVGGDSLNYRTYILYIGGSAERSAGRLVTNVGGNNVLEFYLYNNTLYIKKIVSAYGCRVSIISLRKATQNIGVLTLESNSDTSQMSQIPVL